MSDGPSASASSSAAKEAASWSRGRGEQLLELVDDQERRGLVRRQAAAQRKGGLAGVGEGDAVAQARDIGEQAPELLRGDLDALPQALGRIGAGPHRHHLPDFFARLLARGVDQRPAAEGGREARPRQRRFSRAAVGDYGDQAKLAEFFGELGDLRLAAEEAVRLLLAHRPQPDERLVDQDRRRPGVEVENRREELSELDAVAKRVAHALIALGEGRQRARSLALRRREPG